MTTIGWRAPASIAAASWTLSGCGRTRVVGTEIGATSSVVGASSTSAGRQTKTGPIGGVIAT
jgi:hypothetical protein